MRPTSRRTVLASALALTTVPQASPGALTVDDFHQSRSDDDHAAAFNLAFESARRQRRNLICRRGQTYRLRGPVNIRPDATGWTPELNLNGSVVVLLAENAGFRRRGIKDGEITNVSSGRIYNGSIDANNITGGNGVRCIFGSNSGGTDDAVRIFNMAGGYGWLRHCYVDGGESVGRPRFSGSVTGSRDRGDALKWYGCGDSTDVTVALAGQRVSPGQSVALATPVAGEQDSTGCAPLGQTAYWVNRLNRIVTVPSGSDASMRRRAGLAFVGTDKVVNGARMGAAQAEFFRSGGRDTATGAVPAVGALFSGVRTAGGYYGIVALGQRGVGVEDAELSDCVRGLVGQFGATGLTAERVTLRGTRSSAVLLGYGSGGARLAQLRIHADAGWTGEALVNITLSSGNTTLTDVQTTTPATVLHGQHHVYLGPGCSHSTLSGLRLSGDCIKAFVAVESAWAVVPTVPEARTADATYAGLTALGLTDVAITDVTITVPAETDSTATALALIETRDSIHGEIMLSDVRVSNFRANSAKHTRALRLVPGSADRPLRGLRLNGNVWRLDPATAELARRLSTT